LHSKVPQEWSGRGIGSRLTRGALDLARAEGLEVIAERPFIAAYVASIRSKRRAGGGPPSPREGAAPRRLRRRPPRSPKNESAD
jgi:hypothetical protein